MEVNPQLKVEALVAKRIWQNRRLTCRIEKTEWSWWESKIYLIVLWSNVPDIPNGTKLTFEPPGKDDVIYRTAPSLHIPEEDRADWNAYKAFREGDIWYDNFYRREYYKKNEVKERPVLSMKTGHGLNCLHPNEMVCKTPELASFSKDFFNKWTFVYKIQGKFIEYVKRLALKLNGKPSPRFDDNGFFTLGLQRDEVLNEDGDLIHIKRQNVVWSVVGNSMGDNNYAYFPFSGMQADSLANIANGQLISNTNANVSQIICFRKNIRDVNNEEDRTFPRNNILLRG